MAWKTGVPLPIARLVVLVLWAIVFGIYVKTFTDLGPDQGVHPSEAAHAAWNAAYSFLPVLVAFVTFYLGPDAKKNLRYDNARRVRWDQFFIAVSTTIFCHGWVLYYFYKKVWNASFDYPDDPSQSFLTLTNEGFKMLLLFGMGPIIAANYVLGRNDLSMGQSSSGENTQH